MILFTIRRHFVKITGFSEVATFIDLQNLLKQVYNSLYNGDALARGTLDFQKLWILKIQIKYVDLFELFYNYNILQCNIVFCWIA